MLWITIIEMVIELIIKMPEIISVIQDIMAKLRGHLGPVALEAESLRLHQALIAVKAGDSSAAKATLHAYSTNLDQRLAALTGAVA